MRVGAGPGKLETGLGRLAAAIGVEGNVALSLQAALDVPVGFAVPDEVEATAGSAMRSGLVERDKSGASGFFMPTTW